jgi:UDP-N-acetylmuramate dehydrogenase
VIDIQSLPKVRGRYRSNVKMSKMCWFGVGGDADILFVPADSADLQSFLMQRDHDIPVFVFGVGSNLLVRDGGIRGVVIRLGNGFNYIKHHDHLIKVGAATLDVNVAYYAMEQGIAGLEFLSGIPGTIGGAIKMNAGAYGSDISNLLVTAVAINKCGEVKEFTVEEMNYHYRGNGLSEDWIFTEGNLLGLSGNKLTIQNKVDGIKNSRQITQPIRSKTGGSTFKNPEGYSAWKLIDEAGCRGMQIGDAKVSEQHCNFFINNGDATAADLENLIKEVQSQVLSKTNILLESEIKIVGEEVIN